MEGGSVETARARKRRPLRALAWALGILIGVPALAALGLLAVSALWRSDPAAHMPAGFDAYASLPSAGSFVREALDLKALDAILSTPKLGPARAAVRSLRVEPFLRSKTFNRLADVRVDAATYEGGAFVAVASLGYRSAALRLLPLALRIAPSLFSKAKGLSYVADAMPARFELASEGSRLYAIRYRDVLVVASSEALFLEAARPRLSGVDPALAEALKSRGSGSLRLLVDPATFVAPAAGTGKEVGALLSGIEFPALAVVDLNLKDDRIAVSMELPASTGDPALSALLERRSRTPSALSRLPESASYFSLLSAGAPGKLWEAIGPRLGDKAVAAYKSADDASKAALGMDLEGLLFSWMGDEMGVYGSSLGPEPVFFAAISDEKARRDVFNRVFGSLLVGRDISALVGDTRVPRVVFPKFLRGFLEAVGVKLVEPFYLVEDGFLYASQSAELLVACVAQAREGRLLVKTDRWKDGSGGVSPESSASIFYSLDRSVPFFMRGTTGLSAALRLYGRGVASVRLAKGSIRLELSAVPVAGAASDLLPGFPKAAGGRMSSDPVVGKAPSGAPMAYWTQGPLVVGMDMSSGARFEATMDDAGYLALDAPGGRIAAVWAISERGTAYRMDSSLVPLAGFPRLTGQRVSGPPAVSSGRLLVPVSSEPALMLIPSDGQPRFSGSLGSRPRSRPAVSSYALAALPRSFDAELYLMDLDGALLPGWPVVLPGLASAAPVFAGADTAADGLVAAVTEAGQLFAFGSSAAVAPGFPVRLEGSFDAAPAWAPGWRSIFVVSIEGTLWKIGLDGSMLGRVSVRHGAARGSAVTAFDSDGDGREELYVCGGGDALYAFSGDLSPLQGFPKSGSGVPAFVDVDGDGRFDLIERGADDTLRAYSGR
jgi:hypothetical protein